MRITKFGQSCLLVEDGAGRVLLDPGSFSSGFEQLTGLTGVLITHQHPDHVDVDRLGPLLAANPAAELLCDADTAAGLGGLGPRVVGAGDEVELGLSVRVLGELHAEIHPDIPRVANVGYLLAGRLFHPGDALTVPDVPVEVLALPLVAPWMRVAQTVDYLRTVAPAVAVPIHDAITAAPQIYLGLLDRLGPDETRIQVIDGKGAVPF